MEYQTINPFTEELMKTFPQHTDAQLQEIIAKAEAVYETDWRLRSLAERKKIVKKAAAILREKLDEFAEPITLEMGKLFREAQAEVKLSANILDYYADNAGTFLAPRKLKVAEGEALVESEPLGVLFCVEPWNFPYYQLARVAGPNLMLGNTLIVKHAPNVPQCALAFERLFLDAGAPKGAYTNVYISNQQAATVVADPRIKGVALTGSERAGSAVAAEAGKALKKNTMELGGSDAFIVLDDADMDKAIEWCVCGRMNNAGQCCVGAKRFILQEKIADEFLSRFKSQLAKFVPDDPTDPKTTLAPLCTDGALKLVARQVDTAIKGGGTLLLRGKRGDRAGDVLRRKIL